MLHKITLNDENTTFTVTKQTEATQITIEKSHPYFKQIHYVSCAVSKSGSRPSLQSINVTDDTYIGCDGFRLHMAKTNTNNFLTPALYFVQKCLKTKVILEYLPSEQCYHYPDVSMIIPIESPEDVILHMDNDDIESTQKSSLFTAISIAMNNDNPRNKKNAKVNRLYSINMDYLFDAIKYEGEYTITIKNGTSPVKITSSLHQTTSIVMPIAQEYNLAILK